MKYICYAFIGCFSLICASLAQTSPVDSELVSRISAATVIILTGEGAGRLNAIGSGVIVRPDGVILTAHHVIKGAHEVQIRLHSGDVYDQVTLIGVDERRDVAALRVSARGLVPLALGSGTDVKPGEEAYVVSNANGLAWSASKGIFAASRVADEVPGAGNGFRILQFTAPVSGGASGGPLVDSQGRLIGIITRGIAPNAQSGAAFAVPIESVIGLADGAQSTPLGSGAALQMPSNPTPPSSAALASTKPADLLRKANTIYISSRSMYFTPDTLAKELPKQKEYEGLRLMIVTDPRLADLMIAVDRPLFTYTFTYTVTDSKTSVLLDSGKVTAIDGNAAAGKIAKQLAATWAKVRQPEPDAHAK